MLRSTNLVHPVPQVMDLLSQWPPEQNKQSLKCGQQPVDSLCSKKKKKKKEKATIVSLILKHKMIRDKCVNMYMSMRNYSFDKYM